MACAAQHAGRGICNNKGDAWIHLERNAHTIRTKPRAPVIVTLKACVFREVIANVKVTIGVSAILIVNKHDAAAAVGLDGIEARLLHDEDVAGQQVIVAEHQWTVSELADLLCFLHFSLQGCKVDGIISSLQDSISGAIGT